MSEQEAAENDAPIRSCCGQRHCGPICPDGLVMCCVCFRRVTQDRLAVLEEGDGSGIENAPILVDVCRSCKRREDQWAARVIPPGSDPATVSDPAAGSDRAHHEETSAPGPAGTVDHEETR